jgi:Uma2 family endonuclease
MGNQRSFHSPPTRDPPTWSCGSSSGRISGGAGGVRQLRRERWEALTAEERRGFAPLCPDLVVELASPSDDGPRDMTALRHKMDRYQANGARLGWLLLPRERAVEIWRGSPRSRPKRLNNASRLDGGELDAGLALDLEELWAV